MWSSTASWGRRPSGPSTGQTRSCSWSSTGCRPPDTTTSWWTGAPSSRCLSEVGFAGRSHEYPKVKEERRSGNAVDDERVGVCGTDGGGAGVGRRYGDRPVAGGNRGGRPRHHG